MQDFKDFIPFRKNFNRKKFLVLFGFMSMTLFAFAKSPFRTLKKRLIDKTKGPEVKFRENPLSVKRNKA